MGYRAILPPMGEKKEWANCGDWGEFDSEGLRSLGQAGRAADERAVDCSNV